MAEANTSAGAGQGAPQDRSSSAFDSTPINVTIKSLLDAGAHFGHQTQRWNPKMLPYIYTERNGIHIINLDITLKLWQRARKYIVDTLSRGGNVLVVATKQQAREIVETEGKRSGAFYVTSRWLGGTLTNFETIKNSIDRMRKMEDYLAKADAEGSEVKLKKKEKLMIARQLEKLEANLGGIRNMKRRPDLLFVVDINKEAIAVAEARRLHIPVVALVDTNVDPETVQFPIPSNDDAARTIQLYLSAVADAVIEGRQAYESRRPKEQQEVSQEAGVSAPAVSNGASPEHAAVANGSAA
jgi:small subunit ribosomal protein S2